MIRDLLKSFRDAKRHRVAEKHRQTHGDTYRVFDMELTVPAHVDPGIRYLLAKGRDYEQEEAHFIQQVLKPGDAVIELGGSIGVISRVIRRAIGPDAPHIVVEANPDLAAVCTANAIRGASDGATTVHQAAVAYTDQPTITFELGDTAHTGQIAMEGAANTFEAPVMRLSQLVGDLSGAGYVLVSDIEGAEYQMIRDEPAETFAGLGYAIIEIHPKVFARMGGDEGTFFETAARKGMTLLDRRADVVLLKGPAAG